MFLHLSVPSSTLPDDRKDNTSVCPYCNRGSFGPAPRRHLRPRVVLVVVYGLLAISTVVGLVSLFSPNSSGFKIFDVSAPVSSRKPTLYSPFAEGVQYEIETTPSNYWHNDLYMGEPCNESEAAWNELIHPGRQHGVRLYRDEAAMLDINKSILLPDNNFAVILTVHHNLHCLVYTLKTMTYVWFCILTLVYRDDYARLSTKNNTTQTGQMRSESTIASTASIALNLCVHP
ncbi:hypothetical protein ACMFMG_007944 [Clarireedia jacksonii]